MSQYMAKTVFTHQISPYFYTNKISPNQRAWSTAKDIPSNSPDVVRAHLGAVFGNKMCGYMAPMNLLEFHARVISLTGGDKKFRTGAGGLGSTIDHDGATYKFCMQKVQGKFKKLTGGGMK